MHIGLIASPFITVPPARYGGTELFVAHLAEALQRADIDVTVFTNGESTVKSDIRWLYPKQEWPLSAENAGLLKELDHVSWAMSIASRECDLIHLNSSIAVTFSRFTSKPVVCTMHHPPEEQLTRLYERFDQVRYVAISDHQARAHPSIPSRVIHHGIDLAEYTYSEEKRPYLCYLGRICPIKGAHHAIEIAKGLGMQLKIAGEVQPIFQSYFDQEIRPHIDGVQIQFLGEADHAQKNELLCHAHALLFPIAWEEPFGLVMIEAMACGTPVIAFQGGAVEEVVAPGVSGFICRNVDEAVSALRGLRLAPRIVRTYVEENFSSDVMAARYLELYREQIGDSILREQPNEIMEAK